VLKGITLPAHDLNHAAGRDHVYQLNKHNLVTGNDKANWGISNERWLVIIYKAGTFENDVTLKKKFQNIYLFTIYV
jgi:hypothetical protein